jgi:hypothetical protein
MAFSLQHILAAVCSLERKLNRLYSQLAESGMERPERREFRNSRVDMKLTESGQSSVTC